MDQENVIELYLSRDKILVWNSGDARLLRETHHIVGSLTGALPRAPRQNTQLGLPLELMPEEAHALVSYGAAKMVRLHLPNHSPEDVDKFQEARRLSFQKQKAIYLEQATVREKQYRDYEHPMVSKKKRKRAEKQRRVQKIEAQKSDVCREQGSHLEKQESGSIEQRSAVISVKEQETMQGIVIEEPHSLASSGVQETDLDENQIEHRTMSIDKTKSIGPQALPPTAKICSSQSDYMTAPDNHVGILEQSMPGSNVNCEGIPVSQNRYIRSPTVESKTVMDNPVYKIETSDTSHIRVPSRTMGKWENKLEGKSLIHEKHNGERIVDLSKSRRTNGSSESLVNVGSDLLKQGGGLTEDDRHGTKEQQIVDCVIGLKSDDSSHIKRVCESEPCTKQPVDSLDHVKSYNGPLGVRSQTPEASRGVTDSSQNHTVRSREHSKSSACDTKTSIGDVKLFVEPSGEVDECKACTTKTHDNHMKLSSHPSEGMDDSDKATDDGCRVQLFTEAVNPDVSEVNDWGFPSTDKEKLRAAVFLHFWEQGYYLTSGMKFGGDFLVYKGDPLMFHSTFIAVCVPYDKLMSPQMVISYGRLGPIVKKTVVLCSLDPEDNVKCISLQWSGI